MNFYNHFADASKMVQIILHNILLLGKAISLNYSCESTSSTILPSKRLMMRSA